MRHRPPQLESFLFAEDDAKSVDLSSPCSGCTAQSRDRGQNICTHMKNCIIRPCYGRTNANSPHTASVPFCQKDRGTPRHSVMICTETKPYTESICEAVEAELSRLCCREQMILEGQTFHSKNLLLPLRYTMQLLADGLSCARGDG